MTTVQPIVNTELPYGIVSQSGYPGWHSHSALPSLLFCLTAKVDPSCRVLIQPAAKGRIVSCGYLYIL